LWKQKESQRNTTHEKNYQTFCPYLVGTYARVAQEIGRYIALGFRTWITDIPPNREELTHVMEVYRRAKDLAPQPAE
jgi:alkanesulfonate monooxygenase